ncbi:hypothetical protein AMK59_8644 [Oryctes borbonicus]|uniref:Uncharacterized protein n=1 Tax=Oryctes borbonicus TaxID=1629725 RepID=A0A0T6AV32_9SCAR|nr:hypothetical protein AMK59_8644 [Oryctes borbonicus]
MASGPTMDNKSHWLQQLCKLFCNLDREVIQSVFESCQFNVERTQLLLCDMTFGDTKPIITTPVHYPPYNSPWQGSSPQYDHLSHVVALIRDGCKILILMRGLPGSGKSTLASLLLKEGLGQVFHDEFIFSTDDYFKKSGHYTYDPTQLDEAHRWNQRRCFSNMKKAVSPIIIDNTNLQLREMRVYCVMAVQYGYIVEIMEPNTPWALNPNTLAIRNSHGVDKKKIGEMKTRYQQNLTVADLFKEFCLQYTVQMPQERKYPLLPTPQPIPMSTDIVDKPKKKETKVPVEYVHKFKTRHDDSPDKVRACADADQLLDIGNERKQKETNSEGVFNLSFSISTS